MLSCLAALFALFPAQQQKRLALSRLILRILVEPHHTKLFSNKTFPLNLILKNVNGFILIFFLNLGCYCIALKQSFPAGKEFLSLGEFYNIYCVKAGGSETASCGCLIHFFLFAVYFKIQY